MLDNYSSCSTSRVILKFVKRKDPCLKSDLVVLLLSTIYLTIKSLVLYFGFVLLFIYPLLSKGKNKIMFVFFNPSLLVKATSLNSL